MGNSYEHCGTDGYGFDPQADATQWKSSDTPHEPLHTDFPPAEFPDQFQTAGGQEDPTKQVIVIDQTSQTKEVL